MSLICHKNGWKYFHKENGKCTVCGISESNTYEYAQNHSVEINMTDSKNELEEYNGPKAGKSSNEEWTSVRDYDAFKYVRNGIWNYSDFDCYLYAMCEEYHKKRSRKSRINEFRTG